MRINLSSFLVAAALAATAACGGGGGGGGYGNNNVTGTCASNCNTTPTPPPANTVIAQASPFAFNPTSLTVATGTTVTFTFESTTHNVTFSTAGAPANIPNSANTSVTRVFSTPGTFYFTCTIHPGMNGSVTVQ